MVAMVVPNCVKNSAVRVSSSVSIPLANAKAVAWTLVLHKNASIVSPLCSFYEGKACFFLPWTKIVKQRCLAELEGFVGCSFGWFSV